MRTSCTYCGTQFDVPDKTLGKQARCKSCGKMFVIAPVSKVEDVPMREVKARHDRRASDAKRGAASQSIASDDPLDALADAATESGSHMQPAPSYSRSSPSGRGSQGSRGRMDDDDDRGGRRRMARGAKLAMSLGITSTVLSVGGGVCAIIGMANAKDQNLLVTLGLIAIGLLVVAAALGMMAVTNGTSAGRQIRHARHPLGGRSEASTGMLMGWISLALVLIFAVVGAIWLSNNPDALSFKEEITPQTKTAPKAPPKP